MDTPTSYSIIIGESVRDLVHRVNEEMKKGWVPLGGTFINERGFPSQTVVKY